MPNRPKDKQKEMKAENFRIFFVFVGVFTISLASEAKNDVQEYSNLRSVTSSAILFETPNIPAITQRYTKNKSDTPLLLQLLNYSDSNETCNDLQRGNDKASHFLKSQPKIYIRPESDSEPSIHTRRRGNRGNLDMKMNDEWTKNEHVNHIYIGSSLFPLITEESRVLDKKQTVFGFSTTKKSVTQQKAPRGGGYRLGRPSKEQQTVRERFPRYSGNLGNFDRLDIASSKGYYKQISTPCVMARERFRKFTNREPRNEVQNQVRKRSIQNYTGGKSEEKKIVSGLRRYAFTPDWIRLRRSH